MKESSVSFEVLIQPKSSIDEITGFHDGRLKIRISAPPFDGKANKRLIEFTSKVFGVPKSNVNIIKGKSSKIKTLKVTGIDKEAYNSFVLKYMSE